MDGLSFAPLGPENLAACADMAQTAPDPWSRQALEQAKDDVNRWSFVALNDNEPLGFACFLVVGDNADLEQLVVRPDARRSGVGGALLRHSLPELATHGVQRCLLEVRCGNTAAIALYQALGFKVLARRPGMYQNPAEDGFLMARAL